MSKLNRRSRLFALVCSCVIVFAQTAAGQSKTAAGGCAARKPTATSTTTGGKLRCNCRVAANLVESPSFRVRGLGRNADAVKWAGEFERIRERLYEFWLDRADSPSWSPRCELVVHGTASAYLQAAGRDQAATLGFSSFEMDGCRVVLRRIDIRADQPGWCAGTLGHELTHLVMAEAFADGQLPIWADEGMALLADPLAKQKLHLRDFRVALEKNDVCPLDKFLSSTSYPCRENVPVFYGQSLSLVRYLVDRKSPPEFVRFLKLAGENGYNSALKACYGLNGVSDLEKQWRKSLTGAPLMHF